MQQFKNGKYFIHLKPKSNLNFADPYNFYRTNGTSKASHMEKETPVGRRWSYVSTNDNLENGPFQDGRTGKNW